MKVRLIGIAGGSGAGKSTVAELLTRHLDTQTPVLHFDRYYRNQGHLKLKQRALVNYDHPESLDHELFIKHLDELTSGKKIDAPVYDFATHTRSQATEKITPSKVIVVDGILLMAFPEIKNYLHLCVFVNTPENIRLQRRIKRDVLERGRSEESVKKQFSKSVAPMHDEYVQPFIGSADLIIDGLRAPKVGVEEIISHLGTSL